MKKLLIISGKGGTGKTTVAAAFIAFSGAAAFADCDVDAPNLHMVECLETEPEVSDYIGSQKAVIDPALCAGCGECAKTCRFGAIHRVNGKYEIDEYACEGCGVCALVCPAGAAGLADDVAGVRSLWRGERTFSTATLRMGRGNSGKLVSAVKSALFRAAPDGELAIIDGPPGIGCPVIASVSGADLALCVAEPTNSGLSDLERVLRTASTLGVRTAVCVNRWDICPEKTREIERSCASRGIPFVGAVPYDESASAAINAGRSLAQVDCPARRALLRVFEKVLGLLEETQK